MRHFPFREIMVHECHRGQGGRGRYEVEARRLEMAWFRVQLTEDEQRLVKQERVRHPQSRVREKMLVLWLLHCGGTREKAAEIAGVARSTVQRYVEAFREGGLDGLRRWGGGGGGGALGGLRSGERTGRSPRGDPRVV